MPVIDFVVVEGNVLETRSDLLLLKYAQQSHGLDYEVAQLLKARGLLPEKWRGPRIPDVECIDTNGAFPFRYVMFVGTPPLVDFDYSQMKAMSHRALTAISEQDLKVNRITTTVHGRGYGLDIRESLQSLAAGFRSGPVNSPVRRVIFVERNAGNARMLAEDEMSQRIEDITQLMATPDRQPGEIESLLSTTFSGADAAPDTKADDPVIVTPGNEPAKQLIFVAIPFSEEFEDVFEFGIYGPVKKHEFVCEHVGQSAFTGDVLTRIREKIGAACLVIADLTLGRPNVYLEVGYAWGRDVPVVILAREGQELHFDVQTHRCITYRNITDLARKLDKFLADFVTQGEKS